MNTATLQKAGLTESQAKGYLALVREGNLTATELSVSIDETRTNTYAVCDKLIDLGLAVKTNKGKIAAYKATSPVHLKEILTER